MFFYCLSATKVSNWLFGAISFGCLAQFRLVVWLDSVWLFGAISFGYLAQFRLVIWRLFKHLY